MKKICVISTSRADYYLLSLICKKIKKSKKLKLILVVSGDHFSKQKGFSYKDIINDGLKINHAIPSKFHSDNKKNIILNLSNSFKKYYDAFLNSKPDIIIVLGDRYELMSSVLTAVLMNIPIAHIHGGEITEGAIDDSIRHSITKFSNIHFVTNSIYKKRLIQLGENPKLIFNVGGIGSEIIQKENLLSIKQLEKYLNIKINKKIILVCCHPETASKKKIYYSELFKCLYNLKKKYIIIFTNTNYDYGNKEIYDLINNFKKKNKCYFFKNLGRKKYLSLLKASSVILGNSSSGILEAPCLKTPTINIGNRQKGRIFSESIFSTTFKSKKITNLLIRVLNSKKINFSTHYKSRNASNMIINKLVKLNLASLKIKKFYDL